MSAERKRRAERIIEDFKINYSIPFWKAYRDNNNIEMSRLCTRSYDYKRGVCVADPHARWYQRLNKVDKEVKKMICPEEDDDA